MKKHTVHFYLATWCFYNLQGVLYASGALISQLLLAILLVWSLYYFYVATTNYKLPKVLKVLSILVAIWTVYGMITIISGSIISWIPSYYYIKNIYMSLLPIYAFYVFTKRGQLTEQVLIKWFFVFFAVCIAGYYRNQQEWIEKTWRDEITNNEGYRVLSLLTLLPLFHRRPLIQYVLLAILMYFVLQGFKRGAIITGTIASVFFLMGEMSSNNLSKRGNTFQRVLKIVLTLVIIGAFVYFVQILLETSSYFNEQIERTLEGDSSQRDTLFGTAFFIIFSESNPFRLLFGYGGDATLRLLGNYAHNDWLEIAIDNGLWVIVLYMVFWHVLAQYVLRNRKRNPISYKMTGLFLLIYFVKSLFSMTYSSIPVFAACALGYALSIGVYPTTEKTR